MSFFGSDFEQAEYDRIAQTMPGFAKLQEYEDRLRSTKWFDYRPYHYVAATYLFAHKYTLAYKAFNRAAVGIHKAYHRGMKGKDFMESRERKAIWKCRQVADEMGIQYSFFLRKAMNFCMAAGWKQPPRPCHIHSNPDLLIYVANEWDRDRKAMIRYPKSSFFLSEEWLADPDQKAFETWLIEQIKQRRHPEFALATALYDKRCLRYAAAFESFGGAAIDRAHDHFIQLSK